MNVLVITEVDHEDNEEVQIGVCSSVEAGEDMINEYYGVENFKELYSEVDGMDATMPFTKVLEIKDCVLEKKYKVTVTMEWFTIDKL